MASIYQQVSYGSSGDAVKKLQNLLNQKGYSLDEDGIFGTKTQAAVRDYQKKNGLLLDGIAGDETWGSLMNANTQQQQAVVMPSISGATILALRELEKGYTPSNEVKAAEALRASIASAKPDDYVSSFDEQLQALYDEMAQREAFRYDPAEDAAYQSYAKQYQRQGKLAMEDTMGKAAGLTGGYGSSYAQSAAQQAYAQYLDKLQDVVPALQENAWQQYKAQGDALLQRYELLKGQDETAYKRWQDEVNAWQKAVEDAQKEYEYASSADLKKYQMLLDYYADKASMEIKAAQSGVSIPSVAVSSIGNTASLSSTASESLERAMGNYLKSGNNNAATDLYAQYVGRMTPNQRRTFAQLFAKYGMQV